MTCHEARELFSDRLDEQLDADGAARLAAHLADCDDCRLEWARFERTVSLVRAVEPSRAPAGFVDRVLEAARPVAWPLRLLRQAFTPLRIKLPLEAAALLLVGGLAVMMFQRSPEMQRVARQEHESREAAPAPPPPRPPAEPSAPAPAPPPAAAPPPAPAARPSVAQELRRDTTEPARRESAAKSAAPAAPPLAARARPSAPDVSVWLTVADRTVALTALADAVARLGGRENTRRSEGRADIVDVAIPRAAYEAFIREVSRLGGFVTERQSAELPASVSISLRITD